MAGISSARLARIASRGRRYKPDADPSAPRERFTLTTMLPPRHKKTSWLNARCAGASKPGALNARLAHLGTGDPAIVRLLEKPLRPVVLRPHLSAGLPLNSSQYFAMGRLACKGVFLNL